MVTPKKVPVKKPEKLVEPEVIEVLSLAPFTPIPKLDFNDVKVGISITKKICIKNPTAVDIMVSNSINNYPKLYFKLVLC